MLNIAAITGRLVAEPELRSTGSGVNVCSFTVAVDRSFVRQGEERQCDFIDVVAWRTTAEFVSKYFHKGSMIAVQGSIQVRSYTDKNGINRKAFEIIADNVHFCGGKNEGGNAGFGGQPYAAAPAPAFSTADAGSFKEIPDDDDLPF